MLSINVHMNLCIFHIDVAHQTTGRVKEKIEEVLLKSCEGPD